MKPTLIFLAGAAIFRLLCAAPLDAAEPSAVESKLREGLRNTMLQLRAAETEKAALQAAQAEAEQKNAALTAKLEAMTKQLATEKDAAEKTGTELRAKVDARDAEIARLNDGLQLWKASHKKVSDVAMAKEAQRAKLAGEVIVLQRQVADQQVRNAAMFKLGNEILTRYEKFGLGDALTAREPFIGTTRVKFENLIQDFQDKLEDGRIKPAAGKPAEQKPAAGAPGRTAKVPAARGKIPEQRARP